MGPYGSVGAHIKIGRSPMAHDHFQTPPDPRRDYKRFQKSKKSLKVRAKPAKVNKKMSGLRGDSEHASLICPFPRLFFS